MRADVSRWLSRRTYTATDYQAAAMAAAKRAQGGTVSVVLPALNEERTVGAIVEEIRGGLVERQPLGGQRGGAGTGRGRQRRRRPDGDPGRGCPGPGRSGRRRAARARPRHRQR